MAFNQLGLNYVPPSETREHAYTVRLTDTENARLMLWAWRQRMRRAPATIEAMNRFLDEAGIPRDLSELESEIHRHQMMAKRTA